MTDFRSDRGRDTDSLNDLLRQADPGLQDVDVESLQAQWSELGTRRRVHRRVLKGSLVLLAAGSVAFAMLAGRETNVAEVGPPERSFELAQDVPATKPADAEPMRPGMDPPADGPIVVDSGSKSAPSRNGLPEHEQTIPQPARAERQQWLAGTADVDGAVDEILQELASPAVEDWHRWRQLAGHVRQSPPVLQQMLISRITEDADFANRGRAMRLVVEALGPSANAVLMHWLNSEVTREAAWDMLLARSTDDDLRWLVPLASKPDEREQLCRRIAGLDGPAAAEWFVRLAPERQWRPAIAEASEQLDLEARTRLLSLLRDGSSLQRAGAGFVVGTLPGPEIDRQLAAMIARGRSRQAAYLALLSRGTPAAQQFLNAAIRDVELAPALQSAQYGWRKFGSLTHRWLSELEEKRDDATSAGYPHGHLDWRIIAAGDADSGCTAAA